MVYIIHVYGLGIRRSWTTMMQNMVKVQAWAVQIVEVDYA